MTAADAFNAQPAPFNGAVFGQGIKRISGAGWFEAALVSKNGRKSQPIKLN
jgi:hypothetical protein